MSRALHAWVAAATLAVTTLQVSAPTPATAQPATPIAISVGRIDSEKRCTLYQESAGDAALFATQESVAAFASWRTWWVRDCIDNFASLRTSIEAALASTGKFVVKPSGGTYVVSGRISDLSGENAPPARAAPAGPHDYSFERNFMFVNMDVVLRDSGGRTIHGGLLTKQMETSYDINAGGRRAYGSTSGQALFTQMQHQVALAVARQVAFRLVPMKVTSSNGSSIRLNYGSPLLTMGTMIEATSPDGGTVVRYAVTSSNASTATAELDGDGDPARIVPGSTAVVIEPEDPAANGRRMKRVNLP
ncbi:MAG TPA: hypothetical protein VD929_06515 [Caulobacteraceae bacterium]|nr:hypothetical protein [Caulobacteraceae bacterium]